jgi:hypothetical protein
VQIHVLAAITSPLGGEVETRKGVKPSLVSGEGMWFS